MQTVLITCDACGKEAVRRATPAEARMGHTEIVGGVVCERVIIGHTVYDACVDCLARFKAFFVHGGVRSVTAPARNTT